MLLLAGDVGGTKTLLALYEKDDTSVREVRSARYESASFHGVGPMARLFLGADVRVDRAAFGVAGPVVNDHCEATNLPWKIDARVLERDLGIPRVRLLNDFHAVALGIGALSAGDLEILQDGPVDPLGPVAIIGAGTGLGEAIVIPTRTGPRVLPSEGGHCDLAARNELEIELLRFLLRRHARVSYERIVSGPGLVTAYEFLTSSGHAPETPAIRDEMGQNDPGAVIGGHALAGDDEACVKAVELWLSLYGAEAGNLALKVLPTGGLYVAGGIAPKLIAKMHDGTFLRAFLAKGRMTPLLERTRVSVVTNTRVGLIGARVAAELAAP